MAIEVSKKELTRMGKLYESGKKTVARMKERGEHVAGKAIRTTEMGAVAFGLGVMHGRTIKPDGSSGIEVMGMPIDLILGTGLNLAGYFGLGGKHSDHLNNLGDGALAVYLANMGMSVGVKMAAKSEGGQSLPPSSVAANLPAGSGAPTVAKGNSLSQQEIREAVAAARG